MKQEDEPLINENTCLESVYHNHNTLNMNMKEVQRPRKDTDQLENFELNEIRVEPLEETTSYNNSTSNEVLTVSYTLNIYQIKSI